MRTESVVKIMAVLLKKPCTVKDISQLTGLSYSTVGRALAQIGVEAVKDSWPVKWRMSGDVPVVPTKAQPGEFIDNFVSRWQDGRNKLGKGIVGIEVRPDSDPKEVADQFSQAASTLTNAAYTLREVANKPDWFELIGGNLDDYQVN